METWITLEVLAEQAGLPKDCAPMTAEDEAKLSPFYTLMLQKGRALASIAAEKRIGTRNACDICDEPATLEYVWSNLTSCFGSPPLPLCARCADLFRRFAGTIRAVSP